MIKALSTVYNGYNFRSRLEARWALYFNELGIKYSYEPMGLEVSKGINYLPDFFLTDQNMWAEVKFEPLKQFDFQRCVDLVKSTQTPLVILDGDPGYRSYSVIKPTENGYEVKHLNMVLNETEQFTESQFLYGFDDFPKETVKAIRSCRKHRFGVFE